MLDFVAHNKQGRYTNQVHYENGEQHEHICFDALVKQKQDATLSHRI